MKTDLEKATIKLPPALANQFVITVSNHVAGFGDIVVRQLIPIGVPKLTNGKYVINLQLIRPGEHLQLVKDNQLELEPLDEHPDNPESPAAWPDHVGLDINVSNRTGLGEILLCQRVPTKFIKSKRVIELHLVRPGDQLRVITDDQLNLELPGEDPSNPVPPLKPSA